MGFELVNANQLGAREGGSAIYNPSKITENDIGTAQSNKMTQTLGRFDLIEPFQHHLLVTTTRVFTSQSNSLCDAISIKLLGLNIYTESRWCISLTRKKMSRHISVLKVDCLGRLVVA